MMRRLILPLVCVLAFFSASAQTDTLHVLAIGNSFSVDALEQEMYPLAKSAGKPMIIGNLYHPGCSIKRHHNNMANNIADYSYRRINADGHVDTIPDCTIAQAIAEGGWDYITFQQASHDSGQYETYEKLPELIAMVREAAGSEPIFLWYQTWAYSPNSDHSGFARYGRDQQTMYNAIVDCVKRVMADNPQLKGIIPAGTAIQNARTSAMGRNLTRDGYHLSLDEGRYIAANTWLAVLLGTHALGTPYRPEAMNDEQQRVAQAAADAAIANPFEITQIR